MTFYVGTSGFSYKEWKGPFYPDKIKDREMLAFYASKLTAVEINNTFYRMPKREVIRSWAAETPPDFRFVVKASRRITHFKRLKDPGEPLEYLVNAVTELGDQLGAVLFQLPPNMRIDLPRLEAFLDQVPATMPTAMEFRHASWFDDDVYACLREQNVAICHSDDEDRDLPFVATADWGYLRLRRPGYTKAEMRKWIQRTDEAGFSHCHVFFKHEDEGAGPNLALAFQELAATPLSQRLAGS